MKMFDKIKSLFRPKEPEKVIVHFRLPDGKEFGIEAMKLEYNPQLKCKIHWDYQGVAVPTNNCPICKQIYEQKLLR